MRGRVCMGRAVLAALVAWTLPADRLPGQTPTTGALPGSTRAVAMGGAFGLGAADAEAVFYNAALPLPRAFAAGAQRDPGLWSLLTMAAGAEWFSGTVGLGVAAAGHDDGAAELGAVVAYGRGVGPLRVALGARALELRRGAARDLGGGLDVAVAKRFAWVALGVAGQALGASLLSGAGTPLRAGVRANAGTRTVPLGPFDLAGAATAGLREGGEVEGGAGVEVAWWPLVGRTFIARAGARVPEGGSLAPTLGAAFRGDAIVLEYAWDEATGSHRVGVGWR